MGTLTYRPAIDGLRAIAVLAVVGYHAGLPIAAGYVGVDVFFVISGYLITRLLHEELQATGRIDFTSFYARRARRILPAVVAVIVVTLALAAALLPPLEAMQTGKAAAAAFAFAANVYFGLAPNGYFDGDAQNNPLLHLWSLGVEEQFYLAWPLALLLARRRPALVLWIIAAASFVTAEWLIQAGRGQAAFFQAPPRAWELAVGGLIAIHRPRVPAWFGPVGLVVVLAACALDLPRFPGSGAIPAVLGSAMVVAAVAAGHRLPVLEVRPMVLVGLASYSLYLWHWPVMVLGSGMPTWSKLALAFLLAAGSYRFIEQPFRKRWIFGPKPTVAMASAAVVAGLVGGLATVRHFAEIEDYGNQVFRAVAQARAPSAGDCDDWYHADTLKPCVYGPDGAGRTAVIVGDSVALQWFGPVHGIFDRPGWRLVAHTKSGCPMVDAPVPLKRMDREYTECGTWRRRLLDWIDEEKPDVVIVSSSNGYELSGAQWLEGTRSVVRRLANASGSVVLIRSTPYLVPGSSRPYDDVAAWQREATRDIRNVRFVDMNPYVCPGGTCRRQVDGVAVFRDNRHLTPVFAESLSATLLEQMQLAL